MITASMHQAETEFAKLIRAVVEDGEIVILNQNGKPVAEIHRHLPAVQPVRRLTPDPALHVAFAPGYDPTEPATEDEWPEACR